jgi:hypothetical protein
MKRIKKLQTDIIALQKYAKAAQSVQALKKLIGALDESCLDDITMTKNKMSRMTQKAMDKNKAAGKKFTGPIYGWDDVDGMTVIPNWEEQDMIDYMRYQFYEEKKSGSKIAKTLREEGITGKRGGTWQSSGVLRVIRNPFHGSRQKYPAPEWWGEMHYHDFVKW